MRNDSSTRALEIARAKLDEQLKKTPDDPRLLLLRARADEKLEQYSDAVKFFRRAATLLQRSGDITASVSASLEAANAHARAGELSEANELFDYAIARYEQLDEHVSAALARVTQARVLLDARETAKAWGVLALSIGPLEQGEHWVELGWAYERLTEFAKVSGDPVSALEHAKAAVECAAKAKDRHLFGRRLAIVAGLHLEAGRFGKARQYQERAQGYLKEGGDTLGLLAGFETLAAAAIGNQEPDAARALLEEAIALADTYGKPRPKGQLRVRLAEILVERGEHAQAKDLLEHAVALLHTAGDPRGSAPAFTLLGRIHWSLGERELSLRALARSEQLFRAVGKDSEAERVAQMRERASDGRWDG